MNYRLLPHHQFKNLKDLVHDLYEITTSTSGLEYSTAPNGIIGISIVVRGHSSILKNNNWQKFPRVSIYGLAKKPDVIKISPHFREIAIGFKPYFFQLLLNDSMSNIISTGNVDASDVFNKLDVENLIEQIGLSINDFQIMNAVEAFIIKQVNFSKVNNRLLAAMNFVYNDGNSKVNEIANKINLSSTSVRNLFNEGIGRPPKEVITILRINKILKFKSDEFPSLTALGYHCGYFDQAHFIHEFSNTMGMSPSQYFNHNKLAFDFYNFGRWEGNIFVENY
jgi:AraC-like DNA-binding protein